MHFQELSETEKMETCMKLAGHEGYKHKLTEEDKARTEAQELINKIQAILLSCRHPRLQLSPLF